MSRPLALAPVLLAALFASREGRGQTLPAASPGAGSSLPGPTTPTESTPAQPTETTTRPLVDLRNALPPPTNVVYLQYGVAFTSEFVSAAGPICDNVAVPCILGPGGGLTIRAGWRGTGAVYLGGAYELSKQDPQKLLRLAILQQARGEGRYYFISGRDIEPYLHGAAGVAGYGNEWGVDTWGPAVTLGAGVEAQITRRTVVGLALNYRFLYLQKFQDSAGADRAAGVAQLFGLDLVLEQRDPIFTGR